MAPNPPACSFIQASMAGSRSTAPLNRNNSVLIVAPLSAFEICGYAARLPSLQQNHSPGTVGLVAKNVAPVKATVFYNPDRPCPACRGVRESGRGSRQIWTQTSSFAAFMRCRGLVTQFDLDQLRRKDKVGTLAREFPVAATLRLRGDSVSRECWCSSSPCLAARTTFCFFDLRLYQTLMQPLHVVD